MMEDAQNNLEMIYWMIIIILGIALIGWAIIEGNLIPDLRKINIRNVVKKLPWRNQMPDKKTLELTPNQSKALKAILSAFVEDNSDISEADGSTIHRVAHAKKIGEKLAQ